MSLGYVILLEQQAPTVLAQGPVLCKTIFPLTRAGSRGGGGGGGGGGGNGVSFSHLPPVVWPCSRGLGTPALKDNATE